MSAPAKVYYFHRSKRRNGRTAAGAPGSSRPIPITVLKADRQRAPSGTARFQRGLAMREKECRFAGGAWHDLQAACTSVYSPSAVNSVFRGSTYGILQTGEFREQSALPCIRGASRNVAAACDDSLPPPTGPRSMRSASGCRGRWEPASSRGYADREQAGPRIADARRRDNSCCRHSTVIAGVKVCVLTSVGRLPNTPECARFDNRQWWRSNSAFTVESV